MKCSLEIQKEEKIKGISAEHGSPTWFGDIIGIAVYFFQAT